MANEGITTRGGIRSQVRLRCDMVNSLFCTDSELDGYIQSSYFELYDLLTERFEDWFAKEYQFTTDGVNDKFALPEDFYKLRGVDYVEGATDRATLMPFTLGERNRWSTGGSQSIYGGATLRYRLYGNKLWLRPLPDPDLTIEIIYQPRLATLTGDADEVDGVSGWEEYIVTDVCIKALTKEESDPTVYVMQKAALMKRINEAAANRDAGSPTTVTDVSNANNWGYGPPWPGGEI